MKLTTFIAIFCGLYCLDKKPEVLIGAVFFYFLLQIIAAVFVCLAKESEQGNGDNNSHISH